jgi:hypothetical protein
MRAAPTAGSAAHPVRSLDRVAGEHDPDQHRLEHLINSDREKLAGKRTDTAGPLDVIPARPMQTTSTRPSRFGLTARWPIASVSAEHEGLERKHQRLEPQNQSMHQREGIHSVKNHTPHGADVS